MEDTLKEVEYLITLKVGDFIRENPFLTNHREDLEQEARLAVFQKLKQFDETKSSLHTYVRNHTLYACYKYRTEQAKTIILGDEGVDMIQQQEVDEDLCSYIRQVGVTDETEVRIVELHIRGYTQTQIAEEVGTYQQNVGRILKKFREKGLTNYNNCGRIYKE